MVRVLLVLAVAALLLLVWSFFDVAGTSRPLVLTKPLWLVIVVVLPLLGPLLWLGYGRPRRPRRPPQRPSRGRGPDDDPDFLRGL